MSPTSMSSLGNYEDIWENGQDFCPEMTPAQSPKSDLWNFCWILFPKNDASSIPRIYIFCPEFTDRVLQPVIL